MLADDSVCRSPLFPVVLRRCKLRRTHGPLSDVGAIGQGYPGVVRSDALDLAKTRKAVMCSGNNVSFVRGFREGGGSSRASHVRIEIDCHRHLGPIVLQEITVHDVAPNNELITPAFNGDGAMTRSMASPEGSRESCNGGCAVLEALKPAGRDVRGQ